jgi:hypothetical protein
MMKDMSIGIKVALLIILITFIYLFSVTHMPLTDTGVDQAKTIVPFLLGSVFGTLMGFYWGTSKDRQSAALSPVDKAAVEAAPETKDITNGTTGTR